MQKKTLTTYIAFGIGLAFIATVAFAYREPLSGPTGNNAYGYITRGSEAGIKDGGLSVYAFTANQGVTLKDQTIISGVLSASSDGTPSNLKFGDTTHIVSGIITGGTRSTTIQSDTLKNTSMKHVCGSPTGGIILCP